MKAARNASASSSTTTTPAAAEPAAPETPAAPAGVTDELRAIDVAPLERLLEIRKEEAQLEEFRSRAEQMKDKVQEVVWRRVVTDYTKRAAALEAQALPLKVQVRAEYQKLRALLDRTKAMNEGAELEKSELEFRHAVGELTKKQLDDKLKGPSEVLERCRADLTAIEEQKARFLSAFASEAELEAAPPPKASEPAAKAKEAAAKPAAEPPLPKTEPVAATEPAAEPEPEPDATILAKNPLLQPEPEATILAKAPAGKRQAPPAPPPADVESDATSIVSAEQVAAMSAAAAKAAPAGESEDRTFMLPAAGLLVASDGPAPTEYRLAAMNYLGRADDSHVVIARPGVSRKHALIMAGIGGFNIKDLESQNGTFVNGQRITEQPLKDGDQIVIGDTKILFRIPWPAGQRARA